MSIIKLTSVSPDGKALCFAESTGTVLTITKIVLGVFLDNNLSLKC